MTLTESKKQTKAVYIKTEVNWNITMPYYELVGASCMSSTKLFIKDKTVFGFKSSIFYDSQN